MRRARTVLQNNYFLLRIKFKSVKNAKLQIQKLLNCPNTRSQIRLGIILTIHKHVKTPPEIRYRYQAMQIQTHLAISLHQTENITQAKVILI